MTALFLIALVAWVLQFVAWRREIITRQQVELQLREAQWRLANHSHPALRNRHDLLGGFDA